MRPGPARPTKALCEHRSGPAQELLSHQPPDGCSGRRVHVRRRLIQHHQPPRPQQQPSQAQQLLLPRAQAHRAGQRAQPQPQHRLGAEARAAPRRTARSGPLRAATVPGGGPRSSNVAAARAATAAAAALVPPHKEVAARPAKSARHALGPGSDIDGFSRLRLRLLLPPFLQHAPVNCTTGGAATLSSKTAAAARGAGAVTGRDQPAAAAAHHSHRAPAVEADPTQAAATWEPASMYATANGRTVAAPYRTATAPPCGSSSGPNSAWVTTGSPSSTLSRTEPAMTQGSCGAYDRRRAAVRQQRQLTAAQQRREQAALAGPHAAEYDGQVAAGHGEADVVQAGFRGLYGREEGAGGRVHERAASRPLCPTPPPLPGAAVEVAAAAVAVAAAAVAADEGDSASWISSLPYAPLTTQGKALSGAISIWKSDSEVKATAGVSAAGPPSSTTRPKVAAEKSSPVAAQKKTHSASRYLRTARPDSSEARAEATWSGRSGVPGCMSGESQPSQQASQGPCPAVQGGATAASPSRPAAIA
ncbi:hypothetical protein TSOC_002237 [Tetrabaena socialis]|uniref:Uncharacterized protein n=1 Tax=Tetrabaena socialis TaxID=47790 RepID=A0A2J8AEP7_9CHLO|nr:hypothetical protein TSOC_002237 [Tetrabaena socialis]|eukprot:PNH10979.1 hypothetical protein TSOC_002237 [Tetrabaena socialis]